MDRGYVLIISNVPVLAGRRYGARAGFTKVLQSIGQMGYNIPDKTSGFTVFASAGNYRHYRQSFLFWRGDTLCDR
jgi:hypothetical protein